MLSSMGLPPGDSRAHEAGFSAYLSKPVKQSDLLDAIVTVFAPRPTHSRQEAPARRTAPAGANAPAPHPGGGRQRDQSEAARDALREPRRHGGRRVERSRGGSALSGTAVRRHSDGRADAGDERPRSDGRDPAAGAVDRRTHSHRGHDGARDDRRSRAVPRRRDGRLRVEAAAPGQTARRRRRLLCVGNSGPARSRRADPAGRVRRQPHGARRSHRHVSAWTAPA